MAATDPSSPPRSRSRLDDLPTWVRRLVALLAAVVLVVLVRVLPDVLFEKGSPGWLAYLGGMLALAAVAVVVGVRRRRRRLGGADQARMYRQAMRGGDVPPQADREAWRAELERARSAGRHLRRWHVVGGLVPAVVLAAAVVGAAVFADLPTGVRLVLPLLAIGVVGAALVNLRTYRRQEERASRLLEQL